MNQVVLEKAAAAWCEVFDFAGCPDVARGHCP